MKFVIMFLKTFSQIYWVRIRLVKLSKWYVFNIHILRIVKKMQRHSTIQLFDMDDWLTLNHAIHSEAFKDGLIDYFLTPNEFIPNAKDIAVALDMSVYGHSSESFKTNEVIDISFYLHGELKNRVELDPALSYIMELLNKSFNDLEEAKREDLKQLLQDKVKMFEHYFGIFGSDNYDELITIYYPGYGKTWVDYLEEESLKIRVSKYDLPRSIFLTGFDYKSKVDGWLRRAVKTKNEVLFNPSYEVKGEVLWLA